MYFACYTASGAYPSFSDNCHIGPWTLDPTTPGTWDYRTLDDPLFTTDFVTSYFSNWPSPTNAGGADSVSLIELEYQMTWHAMSANFNSSVQVSNFLTGTAAVYDPFSPSDFFLIGASALASFNVSDTGNFTATCEAWGVYDTTLAAATYPGPWVQFLMQGNELHTPDAFQAWCRITSFVAP